MFFIHYLTYLFLFRIVLTEKYKSIKAIEDDFYQKVIEAKSTEVVAQRCSIKKAFLKISQISQENTCARVKYVLVQVFSCEFCEISKNPFSYRTPPAAVS